MTFPPVPSVDLNLVLIGAAMASVFVTLVALGLRKRRHRDKVGAEPVRTETVPLAVAKLSPMDGAALMAAVGEAEADGQVGRLPGLYLSLARWRLEAGETAAAAELLRKSIRGATTTDLKDTHAKARLALGDIAQGAGDLATACEHWQIARSLFRELRQPRDHDAVEARMQRNGCPTDWVLTDF
jgi:hypothetical protein